jgi:hypothetical protein
MNEEHEPTDPGSPTEPPQAEPDVPERSEESAKVPRPDEAEPAKRQRPETLVELYTAPKAAAPELLAVLAKRDAWITSSEDQDAALQLLGERDRDLAKTRTLAQHVATTHDGRFAGSFEAFLVRAVSPVLYETPGWPPQSGDHGQETFRRLVGHHAQALAEKEPARRLFNAVMIAQSILMARYRLDVPDAVPILSRTLGPPAALRGDRRNPRLVRLRALGDTRLTVDSLRTWLDVLTPWIERAVTAERRAGDALRDAARLEGLAKELEQELAGTRAQYGEARAQIAELSQEVQEKSDRERGVKLARQHEGSQLRGSMAGFLEDDLLALLAAIREGLDLDPPRVSYALERLEDAQHAIEDRVRWLRSSG